MGQKPTKDEKKGPKDAKRNSGKPSKGGTPISAIDPEMIKNLQ